MPRGRCVGIQGITCRFSDFARCARRPQPAQSVDPLALLEFWRCARCRAMTGITIPARPFGPHPLQEDATSLHRPGDAAIASWYISRTHELTATTLLPLQSRDGGPSEARRAIRSFFWRVCHAILQAWLNPENRDCRARRLPPRHRTISTTTCSRPRVSLVGRRRTMQQNGP